MDCKKVILIWFLALLKKLCVMRALIVVDMLLLLVVPFCHWKTVRYVIEFWCFMWHNFPRISFYPWQVLFNLSNNTSPEWQSLIDSFFFFLNLVRDAFFFFPLSMSDISLFILQREISIPCKYGLKHLSDHLFSGIHVMSSTVRMIFVLLLLLLCLCLLNSLI